MNKVWAILAREYLERVRRKSFFIGLVLVPLFMSAVILLPVWLSRVEGEGVSRGLIVDASGLVKAPLEDALAADTLSTGEARYRFVDKELGDAPFLSGDAREQALGTLLGEEAIDWYLEIPANVLETGDCTFHGRVVSNFTQLENIQSRITEILRGERLRRLDLDPALLSELSVHADLKTIQHRGEKASEAGFESLYFGTLTLVMILYMTILVFGTMIQRSILEDKNQHITEVVLSSMSATRFFTGKILGIGAVGLTQYLAWLLLGAGAMAFGLVSSAQLGALPVLSPVTLLAFVSFYVLGFLLFAGLFAAVGAMSTTDQEAQQLMQPLVMLLVVPLVIMVYIFQNPDSAVSVALSLIPVFTPLVMFMRINISQPPLWQIALAYGLLIASVAVVFVISGRIFRVGILMTGKKLSLVEAWRWVRQP
ncbi:MAG: ABC transporter permease [Candidatus Krumholzibacteriia bacterium]|nr:ABC transporter permease [Candidatus Latescibacterota bacterium]